MSIAPIDKQEFIKLSKMVKRRLFNQNLSFTKHKSKVLEILFCSDTHISVEEIVTISKSLNEKVPMTSVYRILSEFETINIVESIIVDEMRRYELSYMKQPHYHIYCHKCNKINEFENDEIHEKFLSELEKISFESTNFSVIVNGICHKCQE